MVAYAQGTNCRRDTVFSDFEMFHHNSLINTGCQCCDICAKTCQCGNCKERLGAFHSFMPALFGLL